jgi:uncharacterized membrane protein (UPF0182 family)
MKHMMKIVLGAIAYLVVAQVLHFASSFLTMNYYTDSNYFGVWSKIMMPAAGAPPAEFYYYSIAFSFIVGLIYSKIYVKVSGFMKAKTVMMKGVKFGLALFFIAGLPFFFTMYLLINLPLGLLLYWLLIDGLLTYLLGGIAIAWLNK